MLIFGLIFLINVLLGKEIINDEPSQSFNKFRVQVKGWPKNKFAPF